MSVVWKEESYPKGHIAYSEDGRFLLAVGPSASHGGVLAWSLWPGSGKTPPRVRDIRRCQSVEEGKRLAEEEAEKRSRKDGKKS